MKLFIFYTGHSVQSRRLRVHYSRIMPPYLSVEERRALELEATTKPSRNRGAAYDVSQHVIDTTYSTAPIKSYRNRLVSMQEAAQAAVRHNSEAHRPEAGLEREALSRLRGLFRSNRIALTPDLVVKTFRDLDAVFFASKLYGNVRVKWKSNMPFGPSCFGCTNSRRHRGAHIALVTRTIFAEKYPKRAMFQTLLHEMVVMCFLLPWAPECY